LRIQEFRDCESEIRIPSIPKSLNSKIVNESKMTLYTFIFYALAIVILIATGLAITRRQPVHAVIYLIVAFLATAGLFFLLGAPLLAAFMVIIYAGAIMVLFLFVVMLFKRSPRKLGLLPQWGPAALLGVVFLAVAATMILKDPGTGIGLQGAAAQPRKFGHFLFDRYWLAIEIVSILLLVVLVAIIQLGKPSPHPSPPRGEGEDEGVNYYKEGLQ
jgi:NADH-quinone oxidoreductase subunit J